MNSRAKQLSSGHKQNDYAELQRNMNNNSGQEKEEAWRKEAKKIGSLFTSNYKKQSMIMTLFF